MAAGRSAWTPTGGAMAGVGIEQPVELASHRSETPGLDLDEQSGAHQVDDKPVGCNLHEVSTPAVPLLEGGMERFLIQGTDGGHDG